MRRIASDIYWGLYGLAHYVQFLVLAALVLLPVAAFTVTTMHIGAPMLHVPLLVAAGHFLVLGLLGYGIYYLPAQLESRVASPEDE